jgi:transposase InsO family protein
VATTTAQDAELPGDRRVNHAYAIPRSSCSCPSFCWDNAVAERFFLNLKMERVWQRNYANHAEAKCDIAVYIVEFYNSQRLHSVLGNLPPSVYERKMAAKEPIVVSEIT